MNFLRSSTTKSRAPHKVDDGATDDTDDNNNNDRNDPHVALLNFQQRVIHYIHNAYHCRDHLHHPPHQSIDTNMDGTVSTSIVEDIMSLVQAMATVWHTYLLQFNNQNESNATTKTKPVSTRTAGHVRVKLTAPDQVHLFLQGMQQVLSTIQVHHRERCQQILSSLTTTDTNVVAIICAHMNDSIHLAQAMETFVLIQPVPHMIQTFQQQVERRPTASPTITTANPDSRQDHGSPHCKATATNDAVLLLDDAVIALEQATLEFGNGCRRDAAIAASEQLAVWVAQQQMSMMNHLLFSYAWEVEYTNNEACRQMIQQYLHPFFTKCQQYLVGRHGDDDDDDGGDASEEFSGTRRYLFHKVLIHTVRATVCWYMRCLIQTKADPVVALRGGGPDPSEPHYYFEHPPRALRRMYDDIRILRKYFQSFCRDHVTLQRMVTDECATLELLHESLLCCHNEHLLQQPQQQQRQVSSTTNSTTTTTPSSLESFIVVLHKRCTKGNALLTRYLVGDLYRIMSPPPSSFQSKSRFRLVVPQYHPHRPGRAIQPALQQLQPDLWRVTSHMKENNDDPMTLVVPDLAAVSFLQVHGMLQSVYQERLSQGIVPLFLCHSLLCLPSLDDDDGDQHYNFATHPKEMMVELFIHPIRTIARTLRR